MIDPIAKRAVTRQRRRRKGRMRRIPKLVRSPLKLATNRPVKPLEVGKWYFWSGGLSRVEVVEEPKCGWQMLRDEFGKQKRHRKPELYATRYDALVAWLREDFISLGYYLEKREITDQYALDQINAIAKIVAVCETVASKK